MINFERPIKFARFFTVKLSMGTACVDNGIKRPVQKALTALVGAHWYKSTYGIFASIWYFCCVAASAYLVNISYNYYVYLSVCVPVLLY